ncbi:MAG TPA: signal peptidase I [Methylophaga sp.]|nr:signal peptidase I [Methylophaga sp.]
MSFPAIMVLLVTVTGLIWLVDRLFWAKHRSADSKEPVVVEYARSFFPIILLVLVIRSFIAEPFRIPSASMLPTLHIGDFILVNKFSYGIRLPVINSKILDVGAPERGDVAVFRYPQQPEIDYIKRVVGLPGDRIGYFDKTLYINGEPAEQKAIDESTLNNMQLSANSEVFYEYFDSDKHMIAINTSRPGAEGEMVVPEGHYFVMGDNRDNSNDSRVWGPVPESHLVGKAFMIWMSWDWQAGGIVWSRLGQSID